MGIYNSELFLKTSVNRTDGSVRFGFEKTEAPGLIVFFRPPLFFSQEHYDEAKFHGTKD